MPWTCSPHVVCIDCVQQPNGAVTNAKAVCHRTPTPHTSRMSTTADKLERPPMADIGNKLHAMVDEFVNNLSTQCDSLVNNVSTQSHMFVARTSGPDVAKAPRSSNRTTTQVLDGLRRPSSSPTVSYNPREGSSQLEPRKSSLQLGKTISRDGGRHSNVAKAMTSKNSRAERGGLHGDVASVHDSGDNITPSAGRKHGRSHNSMSMKGRSMPTVELLSSDHSSDGSIRENIKVTKKKRFEKHAMKNTGNPSAKRSQEWAGTQSPSRSPESSHVLAYSYESDTNSHGTTKPAFETILPSGKWSLRDIESEGGQGNGDSDEGDGTLGPHEGDDNNEEDIGRNEIGSESDDEELPVLPRIPVKRKLTNETKICERRSQRGRTKSTSPQVKKPRTPQIDPTVIRQLYFARRPPNAVSTATPCSISNA